MTETVATALISGGVTLLVCLLTNHYQQSQVMAVLQVKLEELTRQVNKHNQLVERTYRLEEQMHVHEEKIKVANHRIDDLEREG
jgi:predicted Holliday junction resolvase-like endonuclease